MTESYIYGLLGGLMIGLAAMLLMVGLGRIAGISGIYFSGLKSPATNSWALVFVVGLIVGAFVYQLASGTAAPAFDAHPGLVVAGGLIVGFGVKLGSGCTSGHGICGIGRLSVRSIIATMTFMAFGFLTVFLRLHLL